MRIVAAISFLLLSAGLATASEIRVWGTAAVWPEVLVVPEGLNDAIQIAAGARHILALKANGTVVAWGSNDSGQLDVPVGLTDVVKIETYGLTNLAIKSDQTFVMWGFNGANQTTIPSGVTHIHAGFPGFHGAAVVLIDGSIRQWGGFTPSTPPVVNAAQEAGMEAGLGLARLADHSLIMWHDPAADPLRIAAFTPPVGILVNRVIGPFNDSALAITTSGALVPFGYTTDLITLAPTSQLTSNVVDAALGVNHILALKNDGSLITWATSPELAAKIAIPFGWSHPSHISSGYEFSVALWSGSAPNGSSPSNILLTPATVAAGTDTDVDVGLLRALDGDPGDRHVFSLVSGDGDNDNAFFHINGKHLLTSQVIPLSKSAIQLRLRVVDSGGLAYEKSIPIETTGSSGGSPSANTDDNGGIGGCGLGGASIVLLMFSVALRRKFS